MSIPFLKFNLKGQNYMNEQFMLLPMAILNRQAAVSLHSCNDFTGKYGLLLSEPDIQQLLENRKQVLEKNGRVEFGGGVMQKIIMEFVDSPFLYQANYTETLIELQECFYYFKNETLELVPDDELIKFMKKYFDEVCQGSVEFLQSTMLESYSRDVRYNKKEYLAEVGYEDNYEEFLKYDKED